MCVLFSPFSVAVILYFFMLLHLPKLCHKKCARMIVVLMNDAGQKLSCRCYAALYPRE